MALAVLEIVVVRRHGRVCLRADDKIRPVLLVVGACMLLAPGAGIAWLATSLARSQNANYFVPIVIAVIWSLTVVAMCAWHLLKVRRFQTLDSFLEVAKGTARIEQCVVAELVGSRAERFHLTGTGVKALVGRDTYGFEATLAIECENAPPVPLVHIEYGLLEHRRLARFAQKLEREMGIPCLNQVGKGAGKATHKPIP